jgi:hypothetical protein
MPLREAVAAIGTDKTAAEIATALGQTVALPFDSTLRTYAYVADLFGDAAAEGLAQAMTSAGLITAVTRYATVGFDLSLQSVQDKLDAIAAAAPSLAAMCGALKAAGRPTQIAYAYYGMDAPPSESDVEAQRQSLLAEAWAANLWAGVVQPALLGGKTIGEIKALIAAN